MLRRIVGEVAGRLGGAVPPRGPYRASPRIAILGAGAGGLCAAIRLRQAGFDNFTIYEKADGVGGTWRDNTYPGACCDVKSHLYSFSFAPNADWSREYSEQPEILAYFERLVDQFGLAPHLRFGCEIRRLELDDVTGVWTLTDTDGHTYDADLVVSGLGQLNRPQIPDIAGLDGFAGTAFHSARWNHDVDLAHKRVGVVGNAASALQFIPEIAAQVAHLDVYQRSANWVIAKPNRTYTELDKWLFRNVPGAVQLHRWGIYWEFELRYLAFKSPSRLGSLMESVAHRFLDGQIDDPELRAALRPDYPIGAKRVLASDTYYAALARDNVELVTASIDRVGPHAVVTADGEARPTDVLIFATGFDTTHFLAPLEVVGRGGVTLAEAWHDGAEAYLGMCVPQFPNLFLLYGPNTNLGHNSILFMIECQVHYLVQCVRELAGRPGDGVDAPRFWFEVRDDAFADYMRWVQDAMQDRVWLQVANSWYRNAAGKVTNNWPRTTLRYFADTVAPRLAAFDRTPPAREIPGPPAATTTGVGV